MVTVSDIETAVDYFQKISEKVTPYIEWIQGNWFPLVLSAEIVGAVIAIKVGRYRRGICWLAAALATIWVGGTS